MLREIPFQDVDCAVHIGVDHGTASVADIEATMNATGSAYCATHAACLARVVLGFLDNADASKPGLVREHPDDLIEWPFVELLVPAVSPVFAVSDVRKVPHDDRGDTASVCIADKRSGYTVEQEGAAVVSHQYFTDSGHCLQIGLFNRFSHCYNHIRKVNDCLLLIEVSTTLVASQPAPYIPALK